MLDIVCPVDENCRNIYKWVLAFSKKIRTASGSTFGATGTALLCKSYFAQSNAIYCTADYTMFLNSFCGCKSHGH